MEASQEIIEAYSVLSRGSSRARYDQQLDRTPATISLGSHHSKQFTILAKSERDHRPLAHGRSAIPSDPKNGDTKRLLPHSTHRPQYWWQAYHWECTCHCCFLVRSRHFSVRLASLLVKFCLWHCWCGGDMQPIVAMTYPPGTRGWLIGISIALVLNAFYTLVAISIGRSTG